MQNRIQDTGKGAEAVRFYLNRFFSLIMILFLITLAVFAAFSIIPGDGALMRLSMDASEEEVEALREELGLQDPLPVRYFRYVKNVLRGDLGNSYQYEKPVKELLREGLPVTMWLALLSMVLILAASIPLGIAASLKKDGFLDRMIQILTQLLMSIPPFFLGILITILFGITFKWFSPGAYVSLKQSIPGFFSYMLYPAAAIALPKIAMTVKFLRSSLLYEMHMDYVRTARSKGCGRRRILFVHVLKNAMLPVITFLGMMAADVLAGSIVVEQVFSLQGIGRLLIVSIANRDFPVVQAIMLYIALVVVLISFLVDMTYKRLDPRVNWQTGRTG